jgi:hypothetical protein
MINILTIPVHSRLINLQFPFKQRKFNHQSYHFVTAGVAQRTQSRRSHCAQLQLNNGALFIRHPVHVLLQQYQIAPDMHIPPNDNVSIGNCILALLDVTTQTSGINYILALLHVTAVTFLG